MKPIYVLPILAILFALSLFALPAHAGAPGDVQCSLTINRNGQSVTVNRAPCYRQDFPAWCNAYVPAVIVQGQTIRCETPAIVVTATPTRIPTPVPTPTPPPLLERLRRSLPLRSFR